jgi:predicted N-acetyltransferase YhbS
MPSRWQIRWRDATCQAGDVCLATFTTSGYVFVLADYLSGSKMHINLLAQQPQLFDAVTQMLHREWSDFPNWRDATTIQQRLQTRNAREAKTLTLVATTADGALMATASIIHYELQDIDEREFWLGEVITAAEHRGKGLASALVLRLIEEARQREIAALWLYTPDQQALYRRFGWLDVEQREIAGEAVTVMKLAL